MHPNPTRHSVNAPVMNQQNAFSPMPAYGSHPILTCQESADYEKLLLSESSEKVWEAMSHVGEISSAAIMRDYEEYKAFPENPRILVLAGKGYNGGDAILTAAEIAKTKPETSVTVVLTCEKHDCKPLTTKALDYLSSANLVQIEKLPREFSDLQMQGWLAAIAGNTGFDIAIDGMLGMSFVPPLREHLEKFIKILNDAPYIGFRASIDLPSGVGEGPAPLAFKADFTYPTGVPKAPLFNAENDTFIGRVRYLDIGFFNKIPRGLGDVKESLLQPSILDPLRKLRSSLVDKRAQGHLFVVGGSKTLPGALQMCVQAALHSGVGLVTAFAPESLVPSMAAVAPEAMWVSWPETPQGSLSQEGVPILLERLSNATALTIGPGLGREFPTLQWLSNLVQSTTIPMLLDADALFPQIGEACKARSQNAGPVLMTPHLGEFCRLAGSSMHRYQHDVLVNFCKQHNVYTVLKGPITRISDGRDIFCNVYGGPVLARGGSGDILSGLAGGLLAQETTSIDPMKVLCQASVWHGMAADILARKAGQVAVVTRDLLPCLKEVLRT